AQRMSKYAELALLALASAAFIIAVMGRDVLVLYRLSKYGLTSSASITEKEANNHQFVRYKFNVGPEVYYGEGRLWPGTPSFDDLTVGDRVPVYYLADDPSVSTLGDPGQAVRSE